MIEHRRCKGAAGYVTDTAILVGRNMVGFRSLADYRISVVTGLTASTDNIRAVVIDIRVDKVNRVVADTAIRGGVLMNWGSRCFSGVKPDIIAIMARDTIAGDTRVQKRCYRGSEASRRSRVAKGTILVRRQMVGCLDQQIRIGGKDLAVMTTFATSGNARMNGAEESCRRKFSSGIVTETAIISCRDMINLLRGCGTRCMAGRAIFGIDAHVVKNRAHKAVRRMTD